MSVNLSPRSLLDENLPADVAAVLAEESAAPDWLTFEITETSIMADARTAVESWRTKYNDRRPHGSLGKLSATEYSRRHGLALQVED